MRTRKIDPISFAQSAAVIAAATPGKEPKKSKAKSAAPKKSAAPVKLAVAKRVAKVAPAAPAAATVLAGKPLKSFAHEYGFTTKQSRVLLRKAWRAKGSEVRHDLRNRWIFDRSQEAKARAVLKLHRREGVVVAEEGGDEE